MRYLTGCLKIALLLFAASAHATEKQCQLLRYAELPVTMVGAQPTLKGTIDGADALFLVDSGAFFSMLSSASAEKYQLKLGPLPMGFGVRGVGGSAKVWLTRAKDFTLSGLGGGRVIHNVDFLVGGNNFARGEDGIIGQNVLGSSDAEYDLANGFVRLFHTKDCKNKSLAYWPATTGIAEIKIDHTTIAAPHLIGTAMLNGKKIRVMFDTGAWRSVLTLKAANRVGIKLSDEGVVAAGLSSGIGPRMVETWIARFALLDFGGEQIKNAKLRIGDSVLLDDIDMLLGADFFLSHRVFVAAEQHKIYFTYNGGPVFDLSINQTNRITAGPTAGGAAATANTENHDASPADASASNALTANANAKADAKADAEALRRRGAASAGRHDFKNALADLNQAIKLDPTAFESYYQRGETYLQNRQPVLAMNDFDAALKIKPDDTATLLRRGELRLRRNDDAGAREDFTAVAKIAPNDPALSLSIALAYSATQHFEEAIKRLDSWLAAYPKDDRVPAVLNERCWSRATMGKELELALADCNAAIKKGESNSAFLDSRGLVWLRLGNFDKSIADYRASIKLQPKSARTLYGLGFAQRKKGATEEGDKNIRAAIMIAPAIAESYKRMGLGL